jgi:hypothetical protein
MADQLGPSDDPSPIVVLHPPPAGETQWIGGGGKECRTLELMVYLHIFYNSTHTHTHIYSRQSRHIDTSEACFIVIVDLQM